MTKKKKKKSPVLKYEFYLRFDWVMRNQPITTPRNCGVDLFRIREKTEDKKIVHHKK